MATVTHTKAKSNSGVMYSIGKASELPKDIVSWHDQNPYRIWIHSRLNESGYKQLAVNVQWIGKDLVSISDTEKKLRLDLAAMISGEVNESTLGPTTFRNIALGQLLEEHAKLIATQRAKQLNKSKRPVNLVKDFEVEEFKGLSLEFKRHKNVNKLVDELGADKRDSLLIAYAYAEQCANGSKMPAMMTAELFGISKNLVYVAVRTARKNGWLTKSVSGTAKGEMTEAGMKEFKKSDVSSIYEELLRGIEGGK